MSTSHIAFYTNRVGKFQKVRRDRKTNIQTEPGSAKTNANLMHIYSCTPTHKLFTTAHLHRDYTRFVHMPFVLAVHKKHGAPSLPLLSCCPVDTHCRFQKKLDRYWKESISIATGRCHWSSYSSSGWFSASINFTGFWIAKQCKFASRKVAFQYSRYRT